MDPCFNYLRVAFFALAVSVLLSCEGPFADEQSFSGKNLDEIGSMTNARRSHRPGQPQLLVTGLQSGSGSTIGPGGDLFVTEGAVAEFYASTRKPAR